MFLWINEKIYTKLKKMRFFLPNLIRKRLGIEGKATLGYSNEFISLWKKMKL